MFGLNDRTDLPLDHEPVVFLSACPASLVCCLPASQQWKGALASFKAQPLACMKGSGQVLCFPLLAAAQWEDALASFKAQPLACMKGSGQALCFPLLLAAQWEDALASFKARLASGEDVFGPLIRKYLLDNKHRWALAHWDSCGARRGCCGSCCQMQCDLGRKRNV
eukprot:1162133-Pelagomonas_calceolata.AAC.1